AIALRSDGLERGRLGLGNALWTGDVALNERTRVEDAELVVQKVQFFFELSANRGSRVFGQGPNLLLERTPDLLARLVDELFFRIALGPFVRQLVADVLVHLLLQFLRERAVVQDDVL